MALTRVYLPLTAADLEALADGRDLGTPPVPAHGVPRHEARRPPPWAEAFGS